MDKDKKYLTPEYLCHLGIGLLRYDAITNKTESLKAIGHFINYFFKTKINVYKMISKVYESDNLAFLEIVSNLVNVKLTTPNYELGEIKQELINQLEHKLDNNSFNKANKFINYIIKNIENPHFNNTNINIQFEKCLKFILLNDSLDNLESLRLDFYATENSHIEYDKVLSGVFTNYEESIINEEIILEEDEEEIGTALESAAQVQEEVRLVSIMEEIKFIEKKRIAILIGASGAGKSMFLCHGTSEFLTNKKSSDKKHLVFYFTFENSKAETFIRIMANITEIPIDQLKEDIKDPNKKKNIINLYLQRKDPNTVLIISELPPKRHTMNTVEAIMDKTLLKFKDAEVYGVSLDYVDKMLPVDTNKNLRTDESLGLIVDDFKALTKIYDTAGLTVSQFNREGAKKAKSDDEMATATDIGGGWSKFENADIVVTMQVKNTYEELGYNIVVLVNEKHRYYRDGTVINCIYKPQIAKFMIADLETGGKMAGTFDNTSTLDSTNNDLIDKVSLF